MASGKSNAAGRKNSHTSSSPAAMEYSERRPQTEASGALPRNSRARTRANCNRVRRKCGQANKTSPKGRLPSRDSPGSPPRKVAAGIMLRANTSGSSARISATSLTRQEEPDANPNKRDSPINGRVQPCPSTATEKSAPQARCRRKVNEPGSYSQERTGMGTVR